MPKNRTVRLDELNTPFPSARSLALQLSFDDGTSCVIHTPFTMLAFSAHYLGCMVRHCYYRESPHDRISRLTGIQKP